MIKLPLLAVRKCAQCGYEVEDPSAVRCPRCFKSLLAQSSCHGNCNKCGEDQKAAPGKCGDQCKTV